MPADTISLARRIGVALAAVLVLALVFVYLAAPAKAASGTFSNTTFITIPSSGQGSVYPSPINVTGLTGAVTDVQVTYNGFAHTWPADVDTLLVGPSGQTVVLMADAGGSGSVTNVTLTFEDAAAGTVPTPIVSGTYRPTNLGAFNGTAPAPPGPYGAALAIFNGTVPNGTWNLYVYDDLGGFSGAITGGWSLTVTTNGPAITSFAPETAPPGTQVVIVGTNLTGATAVLFGGKPAASFTVNSATQITATVPTGATNGPISVTTPAGSGQSQQIFRVSPPPAVTAFSPGAGSVGTVVTLTGTAFTGATAVQFAGTPAVFTVDSATQISVKVPAGAGAGPITVAGPGGTGQSSQAFVVRHDRTVSIDLSRHAAKGRVVADDGFTKSALGVRVLLQKRTSQGWKTVSSGLTNEKGKYNFSTSIGKSKYRVLAPRTTLSSGDVCLKAVSSAARR